MQPIEKITRLLRVAVPLREILVRENAAMKQNAPRHVIKDAEVEEKERLCKAFSLLAKRLFEDPDDLTDVPEELVTRAKDTVEEIMSLIETNARGLKLLIETHRSLMDAVANAQKELTPSAGVYTAAGLAPKGPAKNQLGVVPVSLNQVL
jgi:hypothetical protein